MLIVGKVGGHGSAMPVDLRLKLICMYWFSGRVMNDSERARNWYTQVAATYSSDQRKDWYSDVADDYNKVRPRYPQSLIDRAIALAQLPPDATILELGCGPGIATVPFARSGFSIVCLEPSAAACEWARQNCAAYPKVAIVNTLFEEWPLEPERFNAV